jgi:hypothetical protein
MGDNPNQMQVGRRSGVCKEFASTTTTTTTIREIWMACIRNRTQISGRVDVVNGEE